MKRIKRVIAVILCLLALPLSVEAAAPQEEPVVLTLWHYYNGAQQQSFDDLVRQFNETVGMQQGIVVVAVSKGSVSGLSDSVLASADGARGADLLPDICAAYADTAYELLMRGKTADLTAYLTQREIDEYVDAYIDEGNLGVPGRLIIFPIAKSTEMMLLNQTDWNAFASETGATVEMLATWEGLTECARMYYEWTDAQTETPDDGKAFFGRDAFANYMLVGSAQLGTEIFRVENGEVTIQLDRAVMRRLWDNYVVPYVNGWFGSYGRFRSDDAKTGLIISLVGSTSGSLYFPSQVTLDDGSSYPIECLCLPLPGFEGTEPYAVQQGAGMVVIRSDEAHERAAATFLKWFTRAENNISFSLWSGYLPVKKNAIDPERMEMAMRNANVSKLLHDIVAMGSEITGSYHLYTTAPFTHGNAARAVVDQSMDQWAKQAVQKRDELVADGMSRGEAVAALTGNEAFDAWLAAFADELEAAVKGK